MVAVVCLSVRLIMPTVAPSVAEPTPQPDEPTWEATPLTDAVWGLETPASGAFFARSAGTFMRSDDGGASWRAVALPDGLTVLQVDPSDHTILYARGDDGLYKSEDDAASWRVIRPFERPTKTRLAVSPADSRVLYLALMADVPGIAGHGGTFELLRSDDGGGSWAEIDRGPPGNFCGWEFLVLQGHPSDPERVFRSSGCLASRDDLFGVRLRESRDRGTTWAPFYYEKPFFPLQLVGGAGLAPTRLYVLAETRSPLKNDTHTSLVRSDDDGATWATRQTWCCADDGPISLTYDPAMPDHVFVVSAAGDLQESRDGGDTWLTSDASGLTGVRGIALGVDGANLFAATDHGLFRRPLRASTTAR